SERGPRTLTMALVAQPPIEAPRELVATLGGGGIDLAWKGARPKAVPPPLSPRVPGQAPGASWPRPPAGAGSPSAAAPARPPAGPAPAGEAPPALVPPPPFSPATPSPGTPAPTVPGGATAGQAGEPQPAAAPAVPRRSGFLVYRRPSSGAYDAPLNEEPLERRTFSDQAAPLGATLCYVVRAVGSTDPLIESAPSNEACLERRDVTPPEVPAGLAVLPRQGGLELLWSPSSEEDLAGYRVYRAAAGAAPERLAELDPGKASYLDESAQKGVAYRYTLTAFDQAGNESAPCEPVEATLP
ncbi:MAG: fibronectin type III domain-containing protein, partial [Betaproteobacteria bacterium]